jgi:hypothetical protein
VIFDCNGFFESETIIKSVEEKAGYIFDFALTGQKYYNGKLLQVSNSTP